MKRLIPISLLLFMLIAGCKKSNNQPTLNFSDLPFKQGNSWTYSRYDQAVNMRDTVTLSIISTYTHQDSSFYLFKQVSSAKNDTARLSLYRDTLKYISGNGEVPFLYIIKFPTTSTSYWWDSSYTCSLDNQIEVSNNSYNGVFQIKWGSLIWQDYQTVQNMYLSKGIGIIRYNQNYSAAAAQAAHGGPSITNYQWDLLSYHLN